MSLLVAVLQVSKLSTSGGGINFIHSLLLHESGGGQLVESHWETGGVGIGSIQDG